MGWTPPPLHLAADEADQVPRLAAFREEHPAPGVTIVTPHHGDEPWRAIIAEGAVPGGGPRESGAIVRYHLRDFMNELDGLFDRSG